MAANAKREQICRIMNAVVSDLKKDKNTLAIFIVGSAATGKVWAESDIDLMRIVKKGRKPVYWKWSEGVRIEITDMLLEDLRRNEEINFEKLETRIANAKDTKIVYDPKSILKRKFKKLTYPDELKLHLIFSQLSDARYCIKGARKSLAFGWGFGIYEGLRASVLCFASALFGLNKVARMPRFWLDDFGKLKRTPKGFAEIYKTVLLKPTSKAERIKLVQQLWQIYKDVLNFCAPDVRAITQKFGGIEKIKRKLKLSTLYASILEEIMKKSA